MDIIKEVKKYIKEKCNEYKNNSDDSYDFWNEHVKYVYEESIKLSKKYNADIEVVSLGALLHDIALICQVGTKKDHHVNGEQLAKEILMKYNYDELKLERVLKCVYNHRSSKNATSIEEICVADADILAHFDNIPMLFNIANKNNINLNNIKDWIFNIFEKDYNDLSDKTKETFKEQYQNICNVILGENYGNKKD